MAPPQWFSTEADIEDDEVSLLASDDSSAGIHNKDLPLTYAAMTDIAADIKSSFSAALSDIKTELLKLTEQMAVNERAGKRRDRALIRLDEITNTHSQHLIDMNRQIEDLDNRRRNNIRVRGVPEAITHDQIRPTLTSIFNKLIERLEQSPIDFDRAHRALRPRAQDGNPPRDIICCLPNYILKEEILQKARSKEQIVFEEAMIQLFQDLSPITLKNRRALKPLLEVLRHKGINYRWKFPFALQANYLGKQHMLKVPNDLQRFCEELQIATVDLPDWYAEFRTPPAINNPQFIPGSSPARSPYQLGKQRRQTDRNSYESPASSKNTKSPRLREARDY